MDCSTLSPRRHTINFLYSTLALVLMLLFANVVYAATAGDENTFRQNLNAAGLTYELTGSNLSINVDQGKMVDALPRLQSLGYLSSKIPDSAIKQKPTLITFTIGIIFTTAILHYNYEVNKSLDKIHVTSYIIPKDASAGSKQECYSFDFTRALFDKTDWNKLSYNDFIKMIPNFNFTTWCRNQMTKEMGKQAPATTTTTTTTKVPATQ